MHRVMFSSLLFLAMLGLLAAQTAYSQDLGSRAQTLLGIEGVGVFGEEVDPEAVKDGLNKGELVTATIKDLKNAGIKVLTDQQLNSAPGRPTLVISVNTLKHAGGVYSFTVSLSLDQIVTLERNPAIRGPAPTWYVLATGACLPEELNTSVMLYVKQLVQQFITDYLITNTQQAPSSAQDVIRKK